MSYVPLERLVDRSNGSMYKLVMLISRRALELAEGAPKLVDAQADAKVTTVAMQEIAGGRVGLKDGEKLDSERR